MKKEGKKRGGKVVAGSATAVVLAALAMFGGKAFGLGGSTGTGEDGTGNVVNEQSSSSNVQESDTTDNTEITTDAEGAVITIEVVKSDYYIDGEEKKLSEVELIIRRADPEKTTFILEDNYASAKAWSDVRELFINLELSVIEQ